MEDKHSCEALDYAVLPQRRSGPGGSGGRCGHAALELLATVSTPVESSASSPKRPYALCSLCFPFLFPISLSPGFFSSPEWHAARLASLNKTHTVTWEEFKKKQKVHPHVILLEL